EKTHKLPLAPRSYPELLGGLPELSQLVAEADLNAPGAVGALKQRLQAAPRASVEAVVQQVNSSPDRLHALIERQNWRPARFSVAADDINYRRFFIVSDLA